MLLFSDNQYLEAIGHVSRASLPRLRRRGRGERYIDVMSLLVDRDGSAAFDRRYVFENVILAARLLDDRERAIAIRADRVASARIERNTVGTRANRGTGDHFSGIGIGNDHHA